MVGFYPSEHVGLPYKMRTYDHTMHQYLGVVHVVPSGDPHGNPSVVVEASVAEATVAEATVAEASVAEASVAEASVAEASVAVVVSSVAAWVIPMESRARECAGTLSRSQA